MYPLYKFFFDKLPVKRYLADSSLHLLNDQESAYLRNLHRKALAVAACMSVIGFLLYYLPVYWDESYNQKSIFISSTIPLGAFSLTLPLVEIVWGLLLMVIEIYLLVLLNIYCVHEIAVATGLISNETKDELRGEVLKLGVEGTTREQQLYGIDPFQGINKKLLFVFNIILRLKGWFGNKLIQFLAKRLLGRFAVRTVLDFIGMPIYMAINAYSTHVVLKQTKTIILGQAIIKDFVPKLPTAPIVKEQEDLIYDALQFIAMSKRDFHQNHLMLTKNVLEHFNIARRPSHILPDNFLERLAAADASTQRICKSIICLGFVLDGSFSSREKTNLGALHAKGVLPFGHAEMAGFVANFYAGRGVESMMARL